MVDWNRIVNGRDRSNRDEQEALLPTRREHVPSAIPATEVTKVALKLRYQLESVVPCELEDDAITRSHSKIITEKVIQTAREAGGEEYKSCVVYCLLVCKKWFRRQAKLELWDADLHLGRALAAEMIAKRIIESEEDQTYLFEHVLLKRFSILIHGEETAASNAIERAVDLHALRVIGSSGYQKCVSHLWKGWLVQDDEDTHRFVPYQEKLNTSYWVHVDPDRMRVPRYQNALQITFSLIYLALFTGVVATPNADADLDVVEWIMYIFTLGFIFDEILKFWKVGRYYIGFWNMFNSTLYALLTVSFIVRMIALGHNYGSKERADWNTLGYHWLSFTAPMFWMRLMLYLDTFKFFGAMLVVVKVMMKESLIFFALLIFVLIGFLQAFTGMASASGPKLDEDAAETIWKGLFNSIMTSPEFDDFDDFAPPFGTILYYIYTFVIMVVLLNILIALFNSAYEDITGNSTDEYMALFAAKTLQFTRAPDENVYIAPLNLVEVFLLVIPFEWWMDTKSYDRLNDYVMGVLYSPLLLITALIEQNDAKNVKENRRKGEDDDDTVEEWEELDFKPGEEDEEWARKVRETSPNVEVDGVTLLVRSLQEEVTQIKEMLEKSKAS